ncbi:MAG: F0F1 ATP synthase subunit delta, partial [Fidelibacterota bacterium]
MPDRKSRRYARALLMVAEQHRALEGVNGSLQILSDLYQRDPSFRLLFFTRKIETSRKLDLLSSVLGEQVHAVALEFLGILDEKRE